MQASDFSGPKAKVARARKHVSDLTAAENQFFANNQPECVKESNAEGLIEHKIRIQVPTDATLAAASIASDAISCLRSALDIAVCECARMSGAQDLKHTYFHFASSEEQWDKSYKGRTKAAPETIVAIMRALKPWAGGNQLLYALSRIAAADKHQLLTPIVVNADEISYDTVKIIRGSDFRFPMPRWNFERNELIFLITGPSDQVEYSGISGRTFFGFGNIDPVPGQPIIPALDNLCGMVQEIIETFEGEMFRPR